MIRRRVRAIIAVLEMKKVIPRAIPRGVLLQQENRPFPRTLSSGSDSTSYNRKGVAGGGRYEEIGASEKKRGTVISNVPKTNCRHDRVYFDVYV